MNSVTAKMSGGLSDAHGWKMVGRALDRARHRALRPSVDLVPFAAADLVAECDSFTNTGRRAQVGKT